MHTVLNEELARYRRESKNKSWWRSKLRAHLSPLKSYKRWPWYLDEVGGLFTLLQAVSLEKCTIGHAIHSGGQYAENSPSHKVSWRCWAIFSPRTSQGTPIFKWPPWKVCPLHAHLLQDKTELQLSSPWFLNHLFAYLIIHYPSIHVVSQALSIKFNNCYMPQPHVLCYEYQIMMHFLPFYPKQDSASPPLNFQESPLLSHTIWGTRWPMRFTWLIPVPLGS